MVFRKPKFSSWLTLSAFVLLAFGLGLAVFSTQQRQTTQTLAVYQEWKCTNAGGTCKTTSSGCAGGFVDDYCPTQGESVKCCMPTSSACVQQLGGRCLTRTPAARYDKCATGQWNSGNYCPGGNEVQCCLPPKPTATPTKKPTPTPTRTPTPTPTPAPTSTTLSLDLLFHGIGKGGDNANPSGGGNPNPQHPTRSVVVDVYDLDDNIIIEGKQGQVTFDPVSGSYKGNVVMGSTLTSGARVIRVKLSHSLRGSISRNITAGTTNAVPVIRLVNGDTNNDARLDILDYNIIIGCYSDFDLPPADCNATKKTQADIDDDGKVNQFDLNLFLREMSVQQI